MHLATRLKSRLKSLAHTVSLSSLHCGVNDTSKVRQLSARRNEPRPPTRIPSHVSIPKPSTSTVRHALCHRTQPFYFHNSIPISFLHFQNSNCRFFLQRNPRQQPSGCNRRSQCCLASVRVLSSTHESKRHSRGKSDRRRPCAATISMHTRVSSIFCHIVRTRHRTISGQASSASNQFCLKSSSSHPCTRRLGNPITTPPSTQSYTSHFPSNPYTTVARLPPVPKTETTARLPGLCLPFAVLIFSFPPPA